MKTLLSDILVLLVVFIAFWYLLKTQGIDVFTLAGESVCDVPIHYKIGSIDPRFNISTDQFIADTKQATEVWDQATGKTLFTYDSTASLSINLIYDERQSLNNQITNLDQGLDNNKTSLQSETQKYDTMAADFKTKLTNLNQRINYWNSQGGAPPDQYSKIISEQQSLQQEANTLNAMAKDLNQSASQYNAQVDKLNQTIDSFNAAIQAKPEEGLYDPQSSTIDIYFDVNHQELIHTLAHELGHSRGLEHVQDPDSIMYPYTNQILTPSQDDLTQLSEVCQENALIEVSRDKIYNYLKNTPLNPNFNSSQQ